VASSKGIAAFEKADIRHWTTLPQAFRMSEFHLPTGKYKVGISLLGGAPTEVKTLGDIQVNDSGKVIHTFKLISL
jgi:hypothetical protein